MSLVRGLRTLESETMIKSQDFLILIKLISLQKEMLKKGQYPTIKNAYIDENSYEFFLKNYLSLRGIGSSLGISKTEISTSLKRCVDSRLLVLYDSENNGLLSLNEDNWHVNKKALFDLIKYAVPYFFPVKQSGLNFGLATGFSAPILAKELTSGGTNPYVWASEYGTIYGQSIEPLYKTVPFASINDQFVYDSFSLIDAYRMGKAREKDIALRLIEEIIMGGK